LSCAVTELDIFLPMQRLQHREVQKLHLEDTDTKLRPEGLVDCNGPESGAINIEDRVRRYREIFAALLAAYVHFACIIQRVTEPLTFVQW
jgi:hypothetical protein